MVIPTTASETVTETSIYLASRSPRRRELLDQIGVDFTLMSFRSGDRADPEVDEMVLAGEAPAVYVRRVALAKARHGQRLIGLRRLPPRLLLSADTTLAVDGEIVGKPVDGGDATAILRRLAGRSHQVLTAVALAEGDRIESVVSTSEVLFRQLDEGEIHRYVASGEPMDKAGAYGIQGRAAIFVEQIRGSHSGIVGLPLCETACLLRTFGYPI
jgi:septum formation protein